MLKHFNMQIKRDTARLLAETPEHTEKRETAKCLLYQSLDWEAKTIPPSPNS
jgi:hypothetical protein